MESGNGLNVLGTNTDNFGNLVAGKTDRLVENAWGGYFDAGDRDRRIQHLGASRMKRNANDLRDARNLAAAELYRLEGEENWNRIFLATTAFGDPRAELSEWTKHEQADAAFVYVRTRRPGTDATIQANARAAILRTAETSAAMANKTGFRWTKENPWEPVMYGTLGVPGAVTLARAHRLSGDPRLLEAAVLACQELLGANPGNICYTTGLGHQSPRNPLVLDSRRRGLPPPRV
jgi:endoglucanase